MKQHFFLLLIWLFFLSNSSCVSHRLTIYPAVELTELDSFYNSNASLCIARADVFIIAGDGTKEEVKKEIQSFVTAHDQQLNTLRQYEMFFYKESEHANLTYIHKFPENLRYKAIMDEKPICSYKWANGHFLGIFEEY